MINSYEPILAFALSLVPGLWAYFAGKRLIARGDDPALSERVIAQNQRLAAVAVFCVVLIVSLARRHWIWALALLFVAQSLGRYSIRRAFYNERLHFVTYLALRLRVFVAFAGFWVLVAAAPYIVVRAGVWRWPVAALVAFLLSAWCLGFNRTLLFILGARRLESTELSVRFAEIARRSGKMMPATYVIGPTGWGWANALALPGARRSAIAFTHAFFASMDEGETVAVFAHEMAHLEHYHRRRLLRIVVL
jgi:Zn-dependent protease with chaperone function